MMNSTVRLATVVMIVALGFGGCSSPPRESGPPPPPPEPEATAAGAEAVQSLSEMADEYEQLDRQQSDANKRLAELLTRYQRRDGALPPGFGPDLNDEQRAVLAERIKTERAGLRSLLQDIVERDRELTDLKARGQELGGRLPASVAAKEGDRHDRIAMDFLIKQGVNADKAYEIVSKLNLTEALVPGFRVWTYYQNGQFGTWVTAGTAGITPQEHQKRLTEVLHAERNAALAELKRTQADLDDTRQIAKRSEVVLDQTAAELAAMAQAAERERAENQRRAADVARREAADETLRYVIGVKSSLVSMNLIDRNLRLKSLESGVAQALNLTTLTSIAIDGSAYGLKRIRKVTLVPEVFILGVDHQVIFDGAFAKLQILNTAKFKTARFLVVVLE
jgi:hypothetical protein